MTSRSPKPDNMRALDDEFRGFDEEEPSREPAQGSCRHGVTGAMCSDTHCRGLDSGASDHGDGKSDAKGATRETRRHSRRNHRNDQESDGEDSDEELESKQAREERKQRREKARLAREERNRTIVRFQVGSELFVTTLGVLEADGERNHLVSMVSGSLPVAKIKVMVEGELQPIPFIDRDEGLFRWIMRYLRGNWRAILDLDIKQQQQLLEEAEFYGLSGLAELIYPRLDPQIREKHVKKLDMAYIGFQAIAEQITAALANVKTPHPFRDMWSVVVKKINEEFGDADKRLAWVDLWFSSIELRQANRERKYAYAINDPSVSTKKDVHRVTLSKIAGIVVDMLKAGTATGDHIRVWRDWIASIWSSWFTAGSAASSGFGDSGGRGEPSAQPTASSTRSAPSSAPSSVQGTTFGRDRLAERREIRFPRAERKTEAKDMNASVANANTSAIANTSATSNDEAANTGANSAPSHVNETSGGGGTTAGDDDLFVDDDLIAAIVRSRIEATRSLA